MFHRKLIRKSRTSPNTNRALKLLSRFVLSACEYRDGDLQRSSMEIEGFTRDSIRRKINAFE